MSEFVTATIRRPPSGCWIFALAIAFSSPALKLSCANFTNDLNVALYPLMSSAIILFLFFLKDFTLPVRRSGLHYIIFATCQGA